MINDYLKICLKYNLNYCPHVQKFDIEKNLSDDKIFDLFHSYQFYSLKLNFHKKGFCIKKKLKKKMRLIHWLANLMISCTDCNKNILILKV